MRFLLVFLCAVAALLAADFKPFVGVDVGYGYNSHSFDSDVGSASGTSFVPELGARAGLNINKNHRVYVNYRYQFAHKLELDMSESGTMTIPGVAIYNCVVQGGGNTWQQFGTDNGTGSCRIATGANSSQNYAFGATVPTYYVSYGGGNYTYSNGTVVRGGVTGYTADTTYTYTAANFNIETNIALHKFVLGYDYIFDNNVFIGILGGLGKATGDATITFTSMADNIAFVATEDISYTATIVGANVGYQFEFGDSSKLNVGLKGEYITAGNQTISIQADDASRNVREYSFKPTEYNVGLYFNYNFSFGSKAKAATKSKAKATKTKAGRKK